MCLTIHPDGREPSDAKVYGHYIARVLHVFSGKPPTTQAIRTVIFFIFLKSRGVQTRKAVRASSHSPLPTGANLSAETDLFLAALFLTEHRMALCQVNVA